MASPTHDNMHLAADQGGLHDEEMQDYNGEPGDEDGEGEGDVIMPNANDDSSEEDEEDAEEEARIREGFIVDEDDEEDDEEGEEERRRRRKRRKKHHRRKEEDEEGLEDDDLELLAENTGTTFKKSKLTRLRRARTSESPEPSSKRKTILESSDDDLDVPHISRRDQDIEKIWDDDRRDQEEAYDDMDMDDFIDDDDDDEGGAPLDEEARAARRMEKMQEQERRKKARRARPELVGIDANAWDEIYDVFGDGHEYDWAMEGDDEFQEEQEIVKQEMKYQDVFEPSEIRHRMLTEDDDLIRAQDIPERMQLATASISQTTSISLHTQLTQEDIGGAALWVTQRLSYNKTRDFFSPDGNKQHLKGSLVMAVTYALGSLFIDEFEVPYIWNNKRDFIRHFDVDDVGKREELITLSELWRIYTLGQKYRSLLERKKSVLASFKRLGVSDSYFEEDILPRMDSVEFIVDTIEWLTMKYKAQKQASEQDFQFHDDEDVEVSKKRKMPSRVSAYELAKKSPLAKLADGFGLEPSEIVRNFQSGTQTHFVHDQELNPLAYAEQFADPDPAKALSADEILRRARMIISTELGKDPILRAQIRKLFQEEAQISVSPTERGISKIDEHHFYYNFKYLHNKPASDMLQSPQFLRMLQAESELLITISINLPADSKANFERRLTEAFSSDGFGDSTRAWNEERARVIQEVLEQHLIPGGIKWLREYIREEVEDTLTETCAYELRTRVDVAPFRTGDMANGDIPSVLAVSWGKGDPQKDAVTCVYLDEEGRMREHTKIDNLVDNELMDEFIDIIRRRKPSVIVIGGLSPTTLKLSHTVKTLIGSPDALPRDDQQLNGFDQPPPNREHFDIPVVYSFDDVARIYSHSDRAEEEFSHLSLTARYCVGLARYMQSPINEFAALGSDITAVTLVDRVQQLLPKEKLLVAFERVLVDVVNKVGVDINKAITDDYYQHLLPFVCGLGPRKARLMISKINGLGGSLVNREQFIKNGILTTKIFLNAAGFLTIFQDFNGDLRQKGRGEEEAPDPLDSTRVHPEDYELARKMATDALELDEEDVHDEHPSQVVSAIMQDRDSEKKLNELNLDDFAISLYESNQDQKRHTLNVIKTELLHPFGEQRGEFRLPDEWKIVTMLSGESDDSLRVGLIVTCQVTRIQKQFVTVRLDSGLEGVIKLPYLTDQVPDHPGKAVAKGQTLPGVIIDRKLDLKHDSFEVELSSRPSDTVAGDAQFRRIKHDDHWDSIHCDKDNELLARKKRAEVDRTRRIIKHPNFHNFTSSQAETFLAQQQRGDVVIRPSSKGVHHLAVTWKVDDGLYQHINVTDPNADPTGQTVGDQLVVDNTHTYADLDELIVNHVQAMARRCEELMAHEKFKQGSEDDLHLFLKNFLAANPAKSMYGFTLNRKKPGHFNLCFLANKNSHVQTWPVRVTPEAYYLFEAAAVGVPELCDAFKVRHLHESQNASTMAGGKTPYGAGGRTPARPMGGATPGRMSVRQVGRTPNPYGGATPRAPVPQPNAYGMPPPGPSQYGAPPSAPFGGYQTPSHRPPQSHPGMPPPSIPNGWGGGGGGGGGWS